jgi:hypothetical protein
MEKEGQIMDDGEVKKCQFCGMGLQSESEQAI